MLSLLEFRIGHSRVVITEMAALKQEISNTLKTKQKTCMHLRKKPLSSTAGLEACSLVLICLR